MLKGKRVRRFVVVCAAAVLVMAAVATVHSLRQRAREKEIDALVARLGDEKQREKAEAELAAVTDDAGIRRIVWHLGDENAAVREGAVKAIVKIGAGAVQPLMDAARRTHASSPEWFRTMPALVQLYHELRREVSPDDQEYERWSRNTRAMLQYAYGNIGAPARGALIKMVSDTQMRADAMEWLACIGDPRDLDLFISHLGDYRPNWMTAAYAAAGLGRIKDAREQRRKAGDAPDADAWREFDARNGEVVQALVAALAGPEARVHVFAAFALGSYKDNETARAAVIAAIKDTQQSPDVRAAAIARLQYVEHQDLRETLFGVLGDATPEVRARAVWTLRYDKDSGTPRRVADLLGSSDSVVCESAVSFFTEGWEEKNILLLAEAYGSLGDAGRQNAIVALERIRDGAYAHGRDEPEIVKKRAKLQSAAEEALRRIQVENNAAHSGGDR